MPEIDRGVATDGFWGETDLQGSADAWAFDGPEGLARLSGAASFSAADPERFRARLTHVQIDHIAVEAFSATPYTASREAAHLAADAAPMLTFLFVRMGTLRLEFPDAVVHLDTDTFAIIDSRDPVTAVAESEVRVLSAVVAVHNLPRHLCERGTTIRSALPLSPLTEGFIAFQTSVLKASTHGRPPMGAQFVHATAELHAAVLAEAHDVSVPSEGAAALRDRMEAYIDAHHRDPDLTPAVVAAAIGIGVRHAHSVFNRGDRTIGRTIRERRVESLAFTLRTADQRLSADELASAHGFRSVTAMDRAFRSRYGASPRAFRSKERIPSAP